MAKKNKYISKNKRAELIRNCQEVYKLLLSLSTHTGNGIYRIN